jgi:predicted DNA-binding protein (MmcQ/YjbR family)
MTPKKTSKIPAATMELYEKLIATNPDIERKGDVHPYPSMNGHMFSYLDQTGTMGLLLPKDELEAFLKKYKTKLFVSYGIVKKDWATVPDSLLKNTKELKKYLQISYQHVQTLKPK